MISRVTNQTMSSFAQRNLQDNMARIAKLQELAAGESLITPPVGRPDRHSGFHADSSRHSGQRAVQAQHR